MIYRWNILFDFIKQNKLISLLIGLSFLSTLRILLLPLISDELTYARIAQNIILKGEYALTDKPSTITPSVPFLIALFYTKFNPVIGYVLAKLLNLIFLITGLRFLFLFLKETDLDLRVTWVVILLTIVNSNFVLWSITLYPEAILFCFFWIFMFYVTAEKTSKHLLFAVISFVVLVLTRYLYAVLAPVLIFSYFNYFKSLIQRREYKVIGRLLVLISFCFIPLLFWFKYVLNVEQETDTGLSYFNRFKENKILYNIKAGIGLIKHYEAGNINGVPAFISLFVPITGIRNWLISIILILTFSLGYLKNLKNDKYSKLLLVIILVMAGLVFAGTGFSRYWLVMLPGYLLGFYLLFKYFKFNDSLFVIMAKMLAIIYVINELRLDYLVLSKL